ncbi:MAG: hypothetical protein AAGI12_02010 [Pseudomonadota bacterium]
MVGNSKVLTVSYGTFSCTLEGFDDSFDTMKAIAEYFRDLAAEDRYFGAEPPQPDADVLARIAARELARGVQARTDGNAVLLKPAATPEAPAVQVAEAPAPEAAPAVQVAEAPAPEAAPAAPVEEPVHETADVDVTDSTDDSAPDVAEAPIEEAGTTAEPTQAAPSEVEAEEAVSEQIEDPAPVETAEVEATEVEAEEADMATETVDIVEEEPDQDEEPQETQAVVEELETEEEVDADELEEAVASATDVASDVDHSRVEEAADAAAFFENTQSQEADIVEDDAVLETVAEPVAYEQPEDIPADVIIESTSEDEGATEEADEEPRDNSLAAKLRRIQAVVGGSYKPKAAQNDTFIEDEHAEDMADAAPTVGDMQSDMGSTEDSTSELLEARARNLRVNQSDASEETIEEAGEEAFASEMTDDGSDDAGADSIFGELDDEILEPMESTLSAEDEADLMAQLADAVSETEEGIYAATEEENSVEETVSADIGSAVADIVQAQESDEEEDLADSAEGESDDETQEQGSDAFRDSDATMSRLMDEAAAKLKDPESRTRRDAYSHLKAAVAAKQAARSMGEDDENRPEDREGDYRKDLADVVRPRRASAAGNSERTRRPAPAPLKLVESQRVDLPEKLPTEAVEPKAPVQPRRIAATMESVPATGGDLPSTAFAGFAKDAGAHELQDMIEAAASYLTHVEGMETFSRPKLMGTVKIAMEDGSFTREDGLRAFGTLLRRNKINKLRGGSFELTSETRYQPEAREMRHVG